jgi:hypothetical protein
VLLVPLGCSLTAANRHRLTCIVVIVPERTGPRFALGAVITVTALFFVIRLAIALLSREVVPGASTEVGDPSRSGPTVPPSRDETKRDAQAKLMTLASEAREAKDTKAASAAYAAHDALRKDDCAATKSSLARAGESIAKEHPAHGALESAQRSVDAYCTMITD